MSETYGELVSLRWLNRAVFRQTLHDGDSAVKFLLLSGHFRINRWRRVRLTVVDGYGVKGERLSLV